MKILLLIIVLFLKSCDDSFQDNKEDVSLPESNSETIANDLNFSIT